MWTFKLQTPLPLIQYQLRSPLQNMNCDEPIFFQMSGNSPIKDFSNDLLPSSFQDSVQQFLNQKALFGDYIIFKQSQVKNENQINYPTEQRLNPDGQDETQNSCKKKSLFHNFQKHLITLLKKIVNINLNSFEENSNSQLAACLWNSFIKARSFNKQILHMVFGIPSTDNYEDQLHRIAEKFKLFKTIWSRHHPDKIFQAQEMIRRKVVQQTKLINKDLLKTNCHVHKFDVFYEYFTSFVNELDDGPIARRMRKDRKSNVIKKLMNQTIHQ